MTVYHVSKNSYSPGTVVSGNNYFEITEARGNAWVEDLLERHRPPESPSRTNCVFTFEELGQALAYGAWLPKPVIYYRVEIADNPTRCPMVLCDLLRISEGRDDAFLKSICDQYWVPDREWNFYELLSDEFQVVEVLNVTDFSTRAWANAQYQGDKVMAKNLFS